MFAVVGAVVSCGCQSFKDGGEAGSDNRSPQASSGDSSSPMGSGGFTAGSEGSSCDSVVCQDPGLCDAGFSVQRKPGACCPSCAPNDDQPVACVEIACPEDLECPLGYVAGGGDNGGCCYECVPDRLFCTTHADCVEATEWQATSCCACPKIISLRLYEEDLCWYGGPDGRRPQVTACARSCDVGLACPCPSEGAPYCQDNHCVGAFVPPPN
jgi:hypothetical protein